MSPGRDERASESTFFRRGICQVERFFKLALAGNFFDDLALEEGLRRAVQKRLANQPDCTESSSNENQRRTAFGNRIPGNSKEANVGD